MTDSPPGQQCIFCLNFFQELTDEHIIPDAIGGSLVIRRVCKDCNSYLGSKVDVHLVSNFLVEIVRFQKGLTGRRKNLKHPLSYGKLVSDPNVGIKWEIGEEAPGKLILDTNVKYYTDENGAQRVAISLDATKEVELPEILEKIAARMLKKGLEMDPASVTPIHRSTENPEVSFTHTINLIGIDQAVLKIVYEIASEELGSDYIQSESSKRLRKFIMNPSANLSDLAELKLRGQMDFLSKFRDIFDFVKSDHLIAIIGQPAKAIYVRIFDFYGALVLIDDDADIGSEHIESTKFVEFDVVVPSHSILNMSQVLSKHLPES
ncbi:HNH endonuclease [Deinococcus sp. SDU3-2]|uniref:HNH endonuclease n=1 Tax=Deinococcus terrestris TaxID=2651870 RepID=A0A7X1TST0_9DEIO|nr:HNH endonuclease [Deinococcus terrestris]MPY67781.1 HNH endonuclease [Deinococcus terrestris]